MKDHPAAIGNRTEARVTAALLDHFDTILTPYGSNCRYDLGIDLNGRLIRVQCKTGRLRYGSVIFNTYSSMEHRKQGIRRTYHKQADLFGVYCPGNAQVYLVPVDDVPSREGNLRIEPTRNYQENKIRWAKLYEVNEVAPSLLARFPTRQVLFPLSYQGRWRTLHTALVSR